MKSKQKQEKMRPPSAEMTIAAVLVLMLFATGRTVLAQGAAPPPPTKVDKIADDLYVLRGDGGNTSVYVTDGGIILVDTKFERDHNDLVSHVSALSNKPIKYAIDTHSHGDHSGGNALLAPAVIIAHEDAYADMVKGNQPGLPDITYRDRLNIHLGGKDVIGYHFGRCHTDGDTFVYFPEHKVLATGDCITTGNGQGIPNPPDSARINIDYKNGGSFLEAINTIDQVLKLDFDVVVPGHGPLVRKTDIVQWHSRLEKLRDRVRTMVREGKSKQDVSDVLVKEFGWDPNGGPLRGVLDGLMAESKP